ncbi:Sodium/hydrogen exchanger 4 [Manis javanica]|nr:Sodium/hydrogen exchanger 4 [Manis javanica]
MVFGMRAMIKRDGRGIRIAPLEVKFLDRRKTDQSESICEMFSLIKNRKSEVRAIRYRRSFDHKRCRLAMRRRYSRDPPGGFRETKVFGFRGNYGAKLKLKELTEGHHQEWSLRLNC